MFVRRFIAGGLMAALPLFAAAASDAEVAALRAELEALRKSFEARVAELEAKLAEKTGAAAPAQTPSPASAAAFNPGVSLILSGTYARLKRDPDTWRLDGFVPAGEEVGPPSRSFTLRESELVLSANVDPYLRAEAVIAAGDDAATVENAYFETLALPRGLRLKAGRFYSGIGYINAQHPHAWDFVDAPLAQQAFLGGQYAEDGIGLRFVAPTDTFLEFGAELGRGRNFPGSEPHTNGFGARALFVRAGGDVGASHSWLAGLSWLEARPRERRFFAEDAAGSLVENAFAGRSRLWLASGVWKWASEGNPRLRNFKLQGEYYRRLEDGRLTYDLGGPGENADAFRSVQSGWYVQGVYQFAPRWRVGLRYDRLNSGLLAAGANTGMLPVLDAHDPHRATVMLDHSPSEYSRFRLQFARDVSRRGEPDNQLMLQYVLSLGAHGAHTY